MSPFGLQPVGLLHTPTGSVGLALLHVWVGLVPCPPQQSLVFVQMSPTGLHPLAGWQMRTCVGPHGAQSRLQQAPPHAGKPLSRNPASPAFCELEQTTPSRRLHCAPVGGGCAHVPNVLPDGIVQMPPQQSVACSQMSPGCPQYDGCAQMPFSQKLEQQSPPAAHVLPSDLHVVEMGVHVLFVPHVPPQH